MARTATYLIDLNTGLPAVGDYLDYAVVSQTSALVVAAPCRLSYVQCNANGSATAAHLPTIFIRDGSVSGVGTLIQPSTEISIGARVSFGNLRMNTGIFLDTASATGAVLVVAYLQDVADASQVPPGARSRL